MAAAAAAVAANRQQEDAQEFLSFLLDSAHQELLALKARVSSAPTGNGAAGCDGANGAKADNAEASGDVEEWLTAGRSKRRGKAAVTRGTTNLQVRH
jgi:ABC-type Fe3+ transport system substrate-binding protein